jgi:16S rRNA (adenine1518-N6/adenine1519-N6)-dimethyltransferase
MAKEKAVNASRQSRRAPRAKKPKLGQNFLADRNQASKIVEALGELATKTVVEIGPGRGVLTDFLTERAQRLIAIELDRVLAAQLRMKYARNPNAEIIEADVLSTDLRNLVQRKPQPLLAGPPRKSTDPPATASVIGNLPYYITSDILLHLFEFHDVIEQIVIMVQREVAERIAAKPGHREYGLLSATAQLYATIQILFTLSPGAFVPPPKVDSTVLRLTIAPRFETLAVDRNGFIDFLKLSFAQKRKTLLNNLRVRYPASDVRLALKAAGAREDVRAEALSLEKASIVFRALNSRAGPVIAAEA